MNAAQVLDHFDRICDAPDAIPRLRRFILDLAVRGKLVEQDPNDERAAELLERIRMEKAGLVKEGGNEKGKVAPPFVEDELLFPLPGNWCWSRLAEIGIVNPRNTIADNLSASFVPMPLIPAEYGVASKHEVRPWEEIKSGYTHFAEGDVALAKITPCFENGKSTIFRGLTGGVGAGTTELHVVRPIIASAEYILIFLKSPSFIDLGIPRMTGTAGQKRVPVDYFAYSPFPLPPVTEQHRIVAKVDELMALCDRLKAAEAEREKRRDRVTASSLHRLNNGANADEFREHARFHLHHLSRLTTRREHIQQLRQTILNLAVRGQLVQQLPTDESPNSLLLEIHEMREGMPSRSKNSTVDDSDQKFFHHLPKVFPSNWMVCRLDDLFRFVDYRGRTPIRTPNGIRLITAKNVRMGYITEEPIEFINAEVYTKWMTRGFPQSGDLLFVTEGATMGYVGMIDLHFTFALAQRTIDLQPYVRSYSKFFLFVLMSPLFQEAILTNSTGTAVKGIKAARLKRIRVLLPPLAEQHRIVARVEELMALCDRLEAQITTTQTESRRLLEAVLHEALNGAT